MGQGYDHGGDGRGLRLTMVAVDPAAVAMLEAPLRALGCVVSRCAPEEAAGVRTDVLLWLARPGDEAALEDAVAVARQPIIIGVPGDRFDEWGFAIGLPGVYLVPADDLQGLVLAVSRASVRSPAVVREGGDGDPLQRLRELGAEMARVAQALDMLGGGVSVADRRADYRGDPGEPAAVDARTIRAMIRARRVRDQYFSGELFADPAWDILLDLMAARLEGRDVGVSSLCIAAAVPPTTALRWISAMTEKGMLVRVADADDRRRVFIRLSADTAERMGACLSALVRGAMPVA